MFECAVLSFSAPVTTSHRCWGAGISLLVAFRWSRLTARESRSMERPLRPRTVFTWLSSQELGEVDQSIATRMYSLPPRTSQQETTLCFSWVVLKIRRRHAGRSCFQESLLGYHSLAHLQWFIMTLVLFLFVCVYARLCWSFPVVAHAPRSRRNGGAAAPRLYPGRIAFSFY